jgi:hypothetical protein
MLLSVFSFQTISFVYIVTAVVGIEAWYEPFLFNFLYRDLFTAMIIGKKLHVEACCNHHFVFKSQYLTVTTPCLCPPASGTECRFLIVFIVLFGDICRLTV